MGLVRLLVVGILTAAALYMVASAVVTLIPYAVGILIILVVFTGIHRWLLSKDESRDIDPT
jgi:Na+/citrate or Na+/malate symporter